MDLFLCMCVLFTVGSMSGWVLELLFRRFFSSHKWINPGFLTGPYLPLYGFGVVGLFLISYFIKLDEWTSMPFWASSLITILIMTAAMTLVEYIAGLIFIKGMGIKLWDYTNRWGNLQGIICPLFTLFWGIIAAIFYFFIEGVCENLLEWFTIHTNSSAWFPFVLGMFYGVMLVDLGYSLKISAKICAFAKEHKVVVRFEELKDYIRNFQVTAKQKIDFILPFKSEVSIKEHLTNYLNDIKDEIAKHKRSGKNN